MRGKTLILTGAVLLAACGGGGEPAVTKEGFIAKADAICTKANAEREALMEPGLLSPPYQYEKIAQYTEKLAGVYAKALTRLAALEVPKGDEQTIASMRKRFERAFSLSDYWVAASRNEDALRGTDIYFSWINLASKAQNVAAKYGLKTCAGFGMP